MDLPHLDKFSPQPLVDQLVTHYRHAIEERRFRPGERLPTIREVAGHAGITRSTVQDAYRRLATMGLVHATVGRGTVVRGGDHEGSATGDGVLSPGARAVFDHLMQLPQMPSSQGPVRCNLAELNPDQNLFPVDAFAGSLERVLSRRGPELLGYGQPTGDLALRALLARFHPTFGVSEGAGDPDEVLVTGGAQQGIDLVLRTFTRSGDGVAVAIPTYHHLFGLLKAHDLRVVPLRSDSGGLAGGLDLDDVERVLARGDVRLLYLMPTFHNPTGRTMDLLERRSLMDVVQHTDVPVLEDEFELDLRFRGEELPPLRGLDARGLTATVRTFSKGLFPGVRLGWIHAPTEVLGPMAAIKRYSDLETSPLLQAALVDFIQSGAVVDYLETLCTAVEKRHAAAQIALAEHMPAGFTWTDPQGGFALWVEGPPGFDGEQLARRAAVNGVLVSPGRLFHVADRPVPGVRLSLSRADEDQVADGIRILGQCARDLLAQTGSPSQRPLIL